VPRVRVAPGCHLGEPAEVMGPAVRMASALLGIGQAGMGQAQQRSVRSGEDPALDGNGRAARPAARRALSCQCHGGSLHPDTLLPIGLGLAGSAFLGPAVEPFLVDAGLGATTAGIVGGAAGGALGTTAGNLITGKPYGESIARGASGGVGTGIGGAIGAQFDSDRHGRLGR
jgi:hypothetical protein